MGLDMYLRGDHTKMQMGGEISRSKLDNDISMKLINHIKEGLAWLYY